MQIALSFIRRFRRADEGQDLLEYGLLAALIAIFALGAVAGLGQHDQERFLDRHRGRKCLTRHSRSSPWGSSPPR